MSVGADPAVPRALPLMPLSPRMHVTDDGRVVDMWHGPGKFQAYHVHDPWPDSPQLGRPLNIPAHKLSPGVVFVVTRENTEAPWWPSALASFRKHFADAPIYFVPVVTGDSGLPAVPPELEPLRQEISRVADGEHKGKISVDMDADALQTAKLALVVGAVLFGELFVVSADADRLRAYIHAKNAKDRAALRTAVGNFSRRGDGGIAGLGGFAEGHTIIVVRAGSRLALHTVWFGEFESTILLADDASAWPLEAEGAAFAYNVVMRRAAGPISFPRMLNWLYHPGDEPELVGLIGTATAQRRADPPAAIASS